MIWNAPEIEVTIGEKTRIASVRVMEVVAARHQPVATAYLDLSNVRFEWGELKPNFTSQVSSLTAVRLLLRWGWRGQELKPLFLGTVLRGHLRETLQVWGLCRGRALVDTRVTRTYQDEEATAIIQHLVDGCGFDAQHVDLCPHIIDKLPLHDNTLVEAITFLNRRLSLVHEYYCDPEGGFHWRPPDLSQEPAFTFTHGQDVSEWKALPGGRFLLTVMGTPVWHSQVVSVVDREGKESRYFVEQVRHTVGINGVGARSQLWLTEVADA